MFYANKNQKKFHHRGWGRKAEICINFFSTSIASCEPENPNQEQTRMKIPPFSRPALHSRLVWIMNWLFNNMSKQKNYVFNETHQQHHQQAKNQLVRKNFDHYQIVVLFSLFYQNHHKSFSFMKTFWWMSKATLWKIHQTWRRTLFSSMTCSKYYPSNRPKPRNDEFYNSSWAFYCVQCLL